MCVSSSFQASATLNTTTQGTMDITKYFCEAPAFAATDETCATSRTGFQAAIDRLEMAGSLQIGSAVECGAAKRCQQECVDMKDVVDDQV